ncbi:uncharacterized protein LOC9640710 [Selaginella moellendorffii]|uniref:uncharacterized protein LOC9640710 n=1 Tax=Selaginella moellendorffii TaxID=88036 RepID=UPI000D1C8925|nr:uncharacterized protein LOC9640710 [Selaginella moellendorffii]|eukprot:XP_024532530.1 uncharacterized protein LOC9640710 [Selaginella moellendorffii]
MVKFAELLGFKGFWMAQEWLSDWTSRNQQELDAIHCNVRIAENHGSEYSVAVEIGSMQMVVMMPAALVIGVEVADELEDLLGDLNSKLQDLAPAKLHTVLDMLLATIMGLDARRKRQKVADDDGGGDEDDEDDEDRVGIFEDEDFVDENSEFFSRSPSSLYGLAVAAASACEADPALKHCRVAVEIGVKVALRIGLLNARIAHAYGLVTEKPLEILLKFESVWGNARLALKKSFYPRSVEVTQGGEPKAEKASYALSTMLPDLVRVFCDFYCLGSRGEWSNYIMSCQLQEAAARENPVLGLVSFMALQLDMLWESCPFCYRLLPASTFKVQPCSNDLCQFTCQETGLGSNVLEAVRASPAVVELEVAFMKFAALSTTRDVLEPFPSFMLKERELRESNGWFGSMNKSPNFANKMVGLVSQALGTVPPVERLAQCSSEAEVVALLEEEWQRCAAAGKPERLPLKLLRFCLATDRLSLRHLGEQERLPIACSDQFVVLYDTPEQEAVLDSSTASFFAFHGSPTYNWYSILRNGVRSMSNTRYMSTGAASGMGIYAATTLAMSRGYCSVGGSGAGYGRFGTGTSCVGVIEVFAPVSLSHYYVIPKEHEKSVALRYLIVFDGVGGYHSSGTISRDVFLDGKINLVKHHRELRNRL